MVKHGREVLFVLFGILFMQVLNYVTAPKGELPEIATVTEGKRVYRVAEFLNLQDHKAPLMFKTVRGEVYVMGDKGFVSEAGLKREKAKKKVLKFLRGIVGWQSL